MKLLLCILLSIANAITLSDLQSNDRNKHIQENIHTFLPHNSINALKLSNRENSHIVTTLTEQRTTHLNQTIQHIIHIITYELNNDTIQNYQTEICSFISEFHHDINLRQIFHQSAPIILDSIHKNTDLSFDNKQQLLNWLKLSIPFQAFNGWFLDGSAISVQLSKVLEIVSLQLLFFVYPHTEIIEYISSADQQKLLNEMRILYNLIAYSTLIQNKKIKIRERTILWDLEYILQWKSDLEKQYRMKMVVVRSDIVFEIDAILPMTKDIDSCKINFNSSRGIMINIYSDLFVEMFKMNIYLDFGGVHIFTGNPRYNFAIWVYFCGYYQYLQNNTSKMNQLLRFVKGNIFNQPTVKHHIINRLMMDNLKRGIESQWVEYGKIVINTLSLELTLQNTNMRHTNHISVGFILFVVLCLLCAMLCYISYKERLCTFNPKNSNI
eukprot:486856_1